MLRCRFQVVSQSVSTVPLQDLVPSENIVYHQILINTDPKSDALQVTFDDNKDDNCWSYHQTLSKYFRFVVHITIKIVIPVML